MTRAPSWSQRRARELRALAHYRPSQVARRAWIRVRRRAASLAPSALRRELAAYRVAPPPVEERFPTDAFVEYALDPVVSPDSRREDLEAGVFRFLESPRRVAKGTGWNERGPAGPSHLWRMNLHYHRFLVDAAAAARRRPDRAGTVIARAVEWLDDWEAACPVAASAAWSDAWNSYAVASRILHAWSAWLLLDGVAAEGVAGFRLRLAGHGASGAAFLERWLEHDLGGNHLLRNAAALAAAGRWFRGPAAERWRARGDRLLGVELSRQILADGFHDERSPMYHALALEELLLARFVAAGASEGSGDDALAATAARMRGALRSVLHADGEIALFNDSALGVAASPTVLDRLAEGLGIPGGPPPGDLPRAGYYRFRDGADVLLFDAGPIGPDHLPAHAHCDVLSFEWSLGGVRVVADTGVDRYEAGPERDFQRGTAAHATLQIEDREQAECFSSFRVGRRPGVSGRRVDDRTVEGRHDGFGSRARHARRLEWHGRRGFAWTDAVSCPTPTEATVRVPLAPGARVETMPGGARVELPGGARVAWTAPSEGAVSVESGVYCPRFGVAVARPVLSWRGRLANGRSARFELAPAGITTGTA